MQIHVCNVVDVDRLDLYGDQLINPIIRELHIFLALIL